MTVLALEKMQVGKQDHLLSLCCDQAFMQFFSLANFLSLKWCQRQWVSPNTAVMSDLAIDDHRSFRARAFFESAGFCASAITFIP